MPVAVGRLHKKKGGGEKEEKGKRCGSDRPGRAETTTVEEGYGDWTGGRPQAPKRGGGERGKRRKGEAAAPRRWTGHRCHKGKRGQKVLFRVLPRPRKGGGGKKGRRGGEGGKVNAGRDVHPQGADRQDKKNVRGGGKSILSSPRAGGIRKKKEGTRDSTAVLFKIVKGKEERERNPAAFLIRAPERERGDQRTPPHSRRGFGAGGGGGRKGEKKGPARRDGAGLRDLRVGEERGVAGPVEAPGVLSIDRKKKGKKKKKNVRQRPAISTPGKGGKGVGRSPSASGGRERRGEKKKGEKELPAGLSWQDEDQSPALLQLVGEKKREKKKKGKVRQKYSIHPSCKGENRCPVVRLHEFERGGEEGGKELAVPTSCPKGKEERSVSPRGANRWKRGKGGKKRRWSTVSKNSPFNRSRAPVEGRETKGCRPRFAVSPGVNKPERGEEKKGGKESEPRQTSKSSARKCRRRGERQRSWRTWP